MSTNVEKDEQDRLAARYAEIAAAQPAQEAAFARFVEETGASRYASEAAAMGLTLDVATGHLGYAPGFAVMPLSFDLLYCRHGKTTGNTEPRVYQGFVDEPQNALNATGLRQAEDAADLLDGMGLTPDLIVCSPLARAYKTGEAYFSRHPELAGRVEVWDDAAEMRFGAWDNVKVKDLAADNICHLFYLAQNALVKPAAPYVDPSSGAEIAAENFVETLARMRRVLLRVEARVAAGGVGGGRARPLVLMYGHSMAGAALSVLTGNGKAVDGADPEYLGFDGKYIMPNATPVFLLRGGATGAGSGGDGGGATGAGSGGDGGGATGAAGGGGDGLLAPFARALDAPGVRRFREEYRSFRAGAHHGARGARLIAAFSRQDSADASRAAGLGAPLLALSAVSGEGAAADAVEAAQHAVNRWRFEYARHRQGAPRGARGELAALAASLSDAQLRLVPTHMLTRYAAAVRRAAERAAAAAEGGLHVHLGAGKLGLGLLLPALATADAPLAVVQRPSGAWKALAAGAAAAAAGGARPTVALSAGGAAYEEFDVATEGDDGAGPALRDDWLTAPGPRGGPARLFVLAGNDSALAARVVAAAASFSTSLGPGVAGVPELLGALPERGPADGGAGERPPLYAGENDHAAVDTLAAALAGRVDVAPCMVDRICTERTVSARAVDVGTEPYEGEVVILHTPAGAAPFPVGAAGARRVLAPRHEPEAEYLCRRKLVTVNGMHTTLAFMTLCARVAGPRGAPLEADKLVAPHDALALLSDASASTDDKARIWAWAVARQLLLLFEHPLAVVRGAHGLAGEDGADGDAKLCAAMLRYARATCDRFGTAADTCGRVLGGGVNTRYKGRLAPVADFLAATPRLDALGRRMLRAADVTEPFMRAAVADLVAEARRFTEDATAYSLDSSA